MDSFQIADMTKGVQNMIEAADIHEGDKVLFLADTRSDQPSLLTSLVSGGTSSLGISILKELGGSSGRPNF